MKIKQTINKAFRTKAAKRSWLSVLLTILFVAVVVVLNIVSNLLVEKFPGLSVDLTSNQVFQLQEKTIDYIKTVDQDVTITVLAEESTLQNSGSAYYVQAAKLIKQFSQYNNKISIKYVDVSKNPTYLNNYKGLDTTATTNLMIVELGKSGTVKSQGKYKVLSSSDLFEITTDDSTYQQYISGSNVEQSITTAILNVTNQNKVKIALITGTGENEDDYSALTTYLENNAYEVVKTPIATANIDSEAKAAIIFMPTVDISKDSLTKLESFLSNNGNYGKNIFYFANSEKVETPNIDKLLENWSMKLSDGLIYETDYSRILQNNPYYFTTDYGTKYIDTLKNQSVPVLAGYSRAVTITDEEVASPLLTTATTTGIRPFSSSDSFKAEDGLKETALNVAAIGTKTSESKSSNLVVFGSAFSVTDSALSTTSFNNSEYIMNLFNQLTQRDDLGITIEGKSVENQELGITSVSDPLILFISTFFRFILPAGILIAGLVVWILRRNK